MGAFKKLDNAERCSAPMTGVFEIVPFNIQVIGRHLDFLSPKNKRAAAQHSRSSIPLHPKSIRTMVSPIEPPQRDAPNVKHVKS